MVSIEPSNLDFPFNAIYSQTNPSKIVFTKIIKLRNIRVEKTRFEIQLVEKQDDFEIVQKKSGSVFPGEYEPVYVTFTPKTWDVKQTVFYVKDSITSKLSPVYITGNSI